MTYAMTRNNFTTSYGVNMTTKKKAAAKKTTHPAVIVRAYSGVFYGRLVSSETGRCTIDGARQIWSWDSTGLPEKSNTCPDIAARGLGTGSKVSTPAERAIIEQVGAVFFCSAAAVVTLEAQRWATR